MDRRELQDLAVAWLILSVAFGNLLGGISVSSVGVALVTVGIGFLLHELAHRIVAQRFGLSAVFRADYQMLLVAFALSFAGFIFAAPGAVYTQGRRTGQQQLLISIAGPITNILLAVGFFFIPGIIGVYGFRINAWLALFNMIPVAGLDGQAVLRQNRWIYGAVVAMSLGLVAAGYLT